MEGNVFSLLMLFPFSLPRAQISSCPSVSQGLRTYTDLLRKPELL